MWVRSPRRITPGEEMSGRTPSGDRARKVLVSLVVIGLVGTVAGLGAYSAFTSTTTNSGNSFASGTVTLSDNDSGGAMYSVSNRKPGDSVTQCIRVDYTGTLDADVKLYTP